MPIYEYLCPDCGVRKEHLQRLADALLSTCPACGGGNYQKQMTAAAFQLKGSGWYVTDFKGGAKPADSAPAEAAAPAAAAAAPAAAPAASTPTSTSGSE